MNTRLAILIPTINGREAFLDRLMTILNPQLIKYSTDVAVLFNKDNQEKSTGQKRNELTEEAYKLGYSHRAFIDDDDTVTNDYLDLNMPGVYGDYDCNSLVGTYTLNGKKNPNKHIFLHSLKYDHWFEDKQYYYRNPNHLNVVKLELVKDIKFPDQNFGEDGQWSEKIHAAGCLKREYEISKPFYNYLARTKVNGV